jgi:hypothetical protein
MTSQIQIDYNKRKRFQNEKEDKNAKRQNKRPKNSTIDKQHYYKTCPQSIEHSTKIPLEMAHSTLVEYSAFQWKYE